MRSFIRCELWLSLVILLGGWPLGATAQTDARSPAELAEIATHIVTGHVQGIYEKSLSLDGWHYRIYLAEVRVAECSKGERISAGELIYVRYWQRKWVGSGEPPEALTGYQGLPAEGEFARIYLVDRGFDGFASNDDGGFNVVGPNGFTLRPLTAANYQERFRQTENDYRQRPQQLTIDELEAILGPGEYVSPTDPDLANSPAGPPAPGIRWERWGFANETFLVGLLDGRATAVAWYVR